MHENQPPTQRKKCGICRNSRKAIRFQPFYSDREMKAAIRKAAAQWPLARLGTIMVPMDFSIAGKKAFRCAINLARQEQADIVLLHVVSPADAGVMESAKKKLLRLCKAEGVSAKKCHALVRCGMPFFEIIQSAQKSGADLIVLGRSDPGPAEQIGDGHTLDRVVRYATCPVLLVREGGMA